MSTPSPSLPLFYLTKNGMYYRPNAAGYTFSIGEAGLFNERIANVHVNGTSLERDERDRVKAVPYTPAPPNAQETALKEAEATLSQVYVDLEPYEDGAPDAGPLARCANTLLPSIRATLAKVRTALKSVGHE